MAFPSPINQYTDLVSISVLVNGNAIDGTYQVLYTMVSKEANKIPLAKLHIIDGDPSKESFSISSSKDFVPGNEVEIKAGYENLTDTIFTGIIVKHGVKLRKGHTSLLVIECRDKAVKMAIGRKNAYYQNLKDSDIMQQVIGSYGLDADVAATTGTVKEVVQYYATDWDFVLSRADINGYIALTDRGKVSIKKPGTTGAPVLGVIYGQTLLGFDIEMDARDQLSSVASSAWDFSTQAMATATAADPGLSMPGDITPSALAAVAAPSTFNLQTTAAISGQALQGWANARLAKSVMAKIRGTISFQGSKLVNPGVMVNIGGLGTRFDGNAFVSAVKHVIEDGNWITEATVGMSPDWIAEARPDIVAPMAAGLLPGIQGLQIGIVAKIDADPDGQFRVQVKIPVIDADASYVWARLSGFYATGKAGSFFYPEINDEVVLGFLNGDPCFPVILGSLFSSVNAPPYTPDEKNTYKAIVTNSQLRIEFDDVKKIITINTPEKNSITISDDEKSITVADQNNNTITLTDKGVSIISATDIEIKASGNITMKANGKIDVAATADASISGMNVAAKAEMEMAVEGTASAKLTASGQVTVKGAMVMIN